jgi:hypothetical protein
MLLLVGAQVRRGLEAFRQETEAGQFPTEAYSPYSMSAAEEANFAHLMAHDAQVRREKSELTKKKLKDQDEYEAIKLY